MTAALRTELRPLFRILPGAKIQAVAERLAMLASTDGVLRHGVCDVKLAAAAGCSPKTAQRTRRYLEAAELLRTVPGSGRTRTQYQWNLPAARALLQGPDLPPLTGEGGREGGQQGVIVWGLSPQWAGRAPRGAARSISVTVMRALCDAVRKIRPDWNVAGIMAATGRALRNGATLDRLRTALLAIARAADSRTPMRVAADGWWWDEKDGRHTSPPQTRRAATPTPSPRREQRKPLQRKPTHHHPTREGRLDEGGGHPGSDVMTEGGRSMPPDFRARIAAARRRS